MSEFWKTYEELASRYIWAKIWSPEHYCPASLLQTKDINGKTPALFISTSTEAGPGKTTSFSYKLLRDFFDSAGVCKFGLIVRHKHEMGTVAAGILDGALELFFKGWRVYEKVSSDKSHSVIYIYNAKDGDKMQCGKVFPIKACDDIRKRSSSFYDIYQLYFDEFQPMDSRNYLPDEAAKFLRMYDAFGRVKDIDGDEEAPPVRVVPVYMCSNTMSVVNDYFLALGISNKIQPDTKKWRGDGMVLEVCRMKGLKEKHEKHPLHRAMSAGGSKVSGMYAENSWLNDNKTNISNKPKFGRSVYLATLMVDTQRFGLKYYPDFNIWYIDYRIDKDCKRIYNVVQDEVINVPLLKECDYFIKLKKALNNGNVWFGSITCKKAVMWFIR